MPDVGTKADLGTLTFFPWPHSLVVNHQLRWHVMKDSHTHYEGIMKMSAVHWIKIMKIPWLHSFVSSHWWSLHNMAQQLLFMTIFLSGQSLTEAGILWKSLMSWNAYHPLAGITWEIVAQYERIIKVPNVGTKADLAMTTFFHDHAFQWSITN